MWTEERGHVERCLSIRIIWTNKSCFQKSEMEFKLPGTCEIYGKARMHLLETYQTCHTGAGKEKRRHDEISLPLVKMCIPHFPFYGNNRNLSRDEEKQTFAYVLYRIIILERKTPDKIFLYGRTEWRRRKRKKYLLGRFIINKQFLHNVEDMKREIERERKRERDGKKKV